MSGAISHFHERTGLCDASDAPSESGPLPSRPLHMNGPVPPSTLAKPFDPSELARSIKDLPALPSALVAAVHALSDDKATASACIAAIERDTALVACMLRLANSALYGARGHVASVSDAVQMLGLRTVASVVAAVSMRSTLVQLNCVGFSFERHWRHALTTAILARQLAQAASQDPGEAFLAGLLHDVGELILVRSCPEKVAQAIRHSKENAIDLYLSERWIVGASHDRIGANVARHWHFPSSIVDAIGYHHAPMAAQSGETLSLSSLVCLSDALAHSLEPESLLLDNSRGSEKWQQLGLPDDDLALLLQRADQEVAAFASI